MLLQIPDIALIGGAFIVDSVAKGENTIIPAISNGVVVLGYSEAGDGGAANYARSNTEPAHNGKFQSLDGAWWELKESVVNPEMFGAIGDDAADDYDAWQNCIDYLDDNGGGSIVCFNGKTYNVETALIFKTNISVDLNSCRINSRLVGTGGSDYGPRGMSGTTIKNGSMYTFSSGSLGSQGIWHSALSFGNAYGDQSTDINNPNAFDEISGVIVDNMEFSTDAVGKFILSTLGLMYNCRFTNIFVPSSSTLGGCFGYDWGVIGSSVPGVGISSDPTLMNESKAYFEAGDGTTRHGYNFVVENWHIRALTKSGPDFPSAVRISGGYGYKVNNINVESCTGTPFIHTAGDLGMEFAPTPVKPFACKDYTWTNLQCGDTGTSAVMLNDSFGDNIERATLPSPDGCDYEPIMEPLQITNCIWDNVVGNSNNAASDRGAIFYFVYGGAYNNFVLSGYNNGIDIQESAARFVINNPVVFNCKSAGIIINQSTRTMPDRIFINNPVAYNCGTNTFLTSKFRAGIYINRASNIVISGGNFGNNNSYVDVTETQLYSVFIDDGASGTILSDNHTYKINGGAAYLCGATSTSYGKVALFSNNTAEAGVTLMGGANIIPIQRYATPSTGTYISEYTCDRATCVGNNPPTGFVSNTGDIIRFRDPNATSNYGLFCFGGGVSGSGAIWNLLNGIS